MKPTQAEINELLETLKSNIDKIPKAKFTTEVVFLLCVCTNQLYDLSNAIQKEIERKEIINDTI